jgi:hypothetical protein
MKEERNRMKNEEKSRRWHPSRLAAANGYAPFSLRSGAYLSLIPRFPKNFMADS